MAERAVERSWTCDLALVDKNAKFVMRGYGSPLPQDNVLAPSRRKREGKRNVIGANTFTCGQSLNHV